MYSGQMPFGQSVINEEQILNAAVRVRGWSCERNNQLNVCTTSVTEGEVVCVKLV